MVVDEDEKMTLAGKKRKIDGNTAHAVHV
jgi:hypothetical protein